MFQIISMFSLVVIYTIVQAEEVFFNCYDLVSLAVTVKNMWNAMIYKWFLYWQISWKRRHSETESTTEDKDGDNSDNLSDQNNNETCTWYKQTLKQYLIFPGEWPPDKNIHSVLNNVLLENNRATQYCSDSVIWLRQWHMSHLPCPNIIVPLPEILEVGVHVPSNETRLRWACIAHLT